MGYAKDAALWRPVSCLSRFQSLLLSQCPTLSVMVYFLCVPFDVLYDVFLCFSWYPSWCHPNSLPTFPVVLRVPFGVHHDVFLCAPHGVFLEMFFLASYLLGILLIRFVSVSLTMSFSVSSVCISILDVLVRLTQLNEVGSVHCLREVNSMRLKLRPKIVSLADSIGQLDYRVCFRSLARFTLYLELQHS